jgi:hypothetical protein
MKKILFLLLVAGVFNQAHSMMSRDNLRHLRENEVLVVLSMENPEILDFNYTYIGEEEFSPDLEEYSYVFEYFPGLKELDVSGWAVSVKTFKEICGKHCKNIKKILISGGGEIDPEIKRYVEAKKIKLILK